MKIKFRNFSNYIHRPPSMADLKGEIFDERGEKRGELLYIVASHNDNQRLKLLFSELKKQTFRKFDICVVYGNNDKFLTGQGLPVLHVRRRIDAGSSGAVYLGQLICAQEGYKYYLASDVDKHPYGHNTLEMMYDCAEKGGYDYVRGRHVFNGITLPQGRRRRLAQPVKPNWIWPFIWSVVRTDTLAKTGLYGLPTYMGCDEVEYHYRLMKCRLKSYELDETVFKTYFAMFKLMHLLQNGGTDNTYHYPKLFALWNMPEILPWHFVCRKNGWYDNVKNFMLGIGFYFFATPLAQKFLEQRAEELKEYARLAQVGKAVAPVWQKNPKLARIEKIVLKKSAGVQTIETFVTRNTFAEFISAYVDTPAFHSEKDYLQIYSNQPIVLMGTGEAYRIVWNKKISLLIKIWLCLPAFAYGARGIALGIWNILLGRHLFDKYGVEEIKKTISKRTQKQPEG